MGKNELDGDPVAAIAGPFGIAEAHREFRIQKYNSKRRKKKPPKYNFFSEHATGGRVGWTSLRFDRGGTVQVAPRNVDWNRLVQGLSSVEVREVQGWAVADFHVKKPGGAAYIVHGAARSSYKV